MKLYKLVFFFSHFNKSGVNSGNGYVLIYPCRLQCSSNATCRFRIDNAAEFDSYCVCPDGQVVNELQGCISGENTEFYQK